MYLLTKASINSFNYYLCFYIMYVCVYVKVGAHNYVCKCRYACTMSAYSHGQRTWGVGPCLLPFARASFVFVFLLFGPDLLPCSIQAGFLPSLFLTSHRSPRTTEDYAFTWVLGNQTQVLFLSSKYFLLPEPSPWPTNVPIKKAFCIHTFLILLNYFIVAAVLIQGKTYGCWYSLLFSNLQMCWYILDVNFCSDTDLVIFFSDYLLKGVFFWRV